MNLGPFSGFDFDHPSQGERERRGNGWGVREESRAEAIARQKRSAEFHLGITLDHLSLLPEIPLDELRALMDDDEVPESDLRIRAKLEAEEELARAREVVERFK